MGEWETRGLGDWKMIEIRPVTYYPLPALQICTDRSMP